jgi:apolipoprotein N-acyltransferase
VLLAVLAGILHGLCFAPAGLWGFAFVAATPLLLAVRGATLAGAALLGWLEGTVASAIAVTPWITAATQDYFRTGPAGAIAFATLIGQVFHALPTAVFAAGARRLQRLPAAARIVTIAGLWTGLELLRSRVLTGAPWDLLGHALSPSPLWMQTADFGGVYAVSFACMAIAACGAELGRAPRTAVVTALAVAGIWAGYGALRLTQERDGDETVRIALVQGNVPNAWRVDPGRAEESFRAFADATAGALAERPALVVWPENAINFLLEPNPRFGGDIARLLGPGGPVLLIGGPRFVQREPGRAEFFNAAYLIAPDGAVAASYDKRRLVPFTEYAPIPRIPALGWRFDSPGDYTPGRTPTVFREPVPFGVLICFEAIYPDLARDLVTGGAELLLNISNDAWFGTTAGLEQHFTIAAFRAVEQRRALARATNTGITALVGPSGRVLARFPTQQRGAWTVDVPLRRGQTLYCRAGDAFAWIATALAVTGLLVAGRRAGGR